MSMIDVIKAALAKAEREQRHWDSQVAQLRHKLAAYEAEERDRP
jgi:hypothetical protein